MNGGAHVSDPPAQLCRVRLTYQYSYTGPITDLHQRLIVIPPSQYGDQRLVAHTLDVTGADASETRWEIDRFGNRVAWVNAAHVANAVVFDTHFEVERVAQPRAVNLPPSTDLMPYLAVTALTAPDDRLRAVATEIAEETVGRDGDDATRAARACEWAAKAIKYKLGMTGVQTPAALALHMGVGVCQDFAHIALTVLRLLNVPARYVSGHLLGEGAPHAWIEVIVPHAEGYRAVAYDPTHGRVPGRNYITVAVGRDYADIAPTSGSFTGLNVSSHLDAAKDARVLAFA